ncbi:hypothetical protein ACHAXR_013097 [Thalassiosira sp. AJA248-18]
MVGSVKSNIGHLEGAAGIAALIKAVLVLAHERVPPNVGLKTLNPLIAKTIKSHEFSIKFPTEVEPMVNEGDGKLLLAGVSSFGYSGTIAHAIVQQAPLDMRRSVAEIDDQVVENEVKENKDIVFLFTGQGSQYAGMGKELYHDNDAFRKAMDRCESIYQTLTDGKSLLDTMFNAEDEERVTLNAQPALVALEWSLAKMWQSNGVAPSIVLGHSVGEIAAACVAGAMTIETALEMVVARARLVNQLPHNIGTMVAVRCSMNEAEAAMASCLSEDEQHLVGVASVNGPNSIVISGMADVVNKVLLSMDKKGVHLQVSHAFHSPLMGAMQAEFRRIVESLDIQQALTTPLASTVAGRIIKAGEIIDLEHWVKQLVAPVLFEHAFKDAMEHNEQSCDIIVEFGPTPVLSKMAKSWWKQNGSHPDPLWVVSVEKGGPLAFEEYLQDIDIALGMKSQMANSALDGIFPNRTRLPWPENPPHPLLQHALSIGSQGLEFNTIFHDKLIELYRDHVIGRRTIFPGTGYIEMGLAAGVLMHSNGTTFGNGLGVKLVNVKYHHPFDVEAGCEMISRHHFGGGMEFKRKSPVGDELTVASIDEIAIVNIGLSDSSSRSAPLDSLKASHTREVPNADIKDRYARLADNGYHRGAFQGIQSVFLNEDSMSALGKVALPEGFGHVHDGYYHAHPAMLDAALNVSGFLFESYANGESWVPARVSRVTMYRSGNFLHGREIWAHVTLLDDGSEMKSATVEIFDESGLLLSYEGLQAAKLRSFIKPEPSMYTTKWVHSSADFDAENAIGSYDSLAIIELAGCLSFDTSLLPEELDFSVLSVSDIGSLGADQIPSTLIVAVSPVWTEFSRADDNSLIEECLLFLQTLVLKLRDATCADDGITRQVCFWTRNAGGPYVHGVESKIEDGGGSIIDDFSSVVVGSILGLVRSAALEINFNVLRMICVDTDCSWTDRNGVNLVLHEMQGNRDVGDMLEVDVSYRENNRYVRRLQRSKHHVIGDIDHKQEPNIGVAVITGGLGGLGLVTAELLVDMGATHVVLVSRSGKVKHAGQGLEERLSRLQQLHDGEVVSVECCDMSEEETVKSLLARVREKHGSINTIVHASGVVHDDWLQNMTAETVQASFGAKAAGAWYLHDQTKNDDILHFVMFSSISALTGSKRLACYAGANSYLDSLVRYRGHNDLPATSIQWPAIADVGMAADSRISRQHLLGLSDVRNTLMQVFSSMNDKREMLKSPLTHTLIREGNYPIRMKAFMSSVGPENMNKTSVRTALGSKEVKGKVHSKVWGLDQIRADVVAAVRKVVTINSQSIDLNTSLMDIGVDSLGSTELSELLQSHFGVDLPSTFVLSYPTIEEMANHLFGLLRNEVQVGGGVNDDLPEISGTKALAVTDLSIVANKSSKVWSMDFISSETSQRLLSELPTYEIASRKQHVNSSFQPNSSKPRLLCLHGGGANNDIASVQAGGLKLSTRFECVFVHAPHITDSFPGLDEFFSGPFRSWATASNLRLKAWFDGGSTTEFPIDSHETCQWDDSLEYLATFCKENGPFDGVYGFSQGAGMVTNFSHPTIWKDRFHMEQCPWKFAILACGTFDYLVTTGKDTPVALPSFHIHGENDIFVNQSKTIATFWDTSQKETSSHGGGHEIGSQIWTRETEMMELLKNFLDNQNHDQSGVGHDLEKNAMMQLKSLDEVLEKIQLVRLNLQKVLQGYEKERQD